MGNLMTSMYTGVSGLIVNQTSINTTAHNISNVDTKGYSRQQILSTDFTYTMIGQSYTEYKQVGLGTTMASIRQVRDVFLDKSYRLELGRQNFYEFQSETVEEIESVFGELNGEAFRETLSGLWTAVSELAKEPDNIVNRGVLVTTAEEFIRRAETISKQMGEYQVNLNKQIQEQVDRINEIGEKIKELNQTIRKYECTNQQANDYRDTRNSLLDELAGMANISYKEDGYGVVTVSIEGVQFVSENDVFHIETQRTVIQEEKDKAAEINKYSKVLSQIIKTSTDPADAESAVKGNAAWSELKKYGKISYNNDGSISFDDFTLIDKSGNVTEYLPKQSDLLSILWRGNGCGEVFKIDGNYNSAANTDVGGLKGLLISRGTYEANYTEIPKARDYANGEEDPAYLAAVNKYNKYVDASIIMATQSQFDQLVNSIVTQINDILCPNTVINKDSINDMLAVQYGKSDSSVNMSTAKLRLADGSMLDITNDVLIFDAMNAGCGMDDNHTQGEALFERKSVERYTKATLTVTITNEDNTVETKTLDVLVYNKEYASNNYSLFSIGQIEVNEDVLNDYNLIPLTSNKYSGEFGAINQKVAMALIDLWDAENLKIDPNTLTKNNFIDYYSAMTTNIAYKGSTYRSIAKNQDDMVESIDNKRQEVLGTSSDEELSNLIKFQHAYNASSRYINAINEMLGQIIDKLGH